MELNLITVAILSLAYAVGMFVGYLMFHQDDDDIDATTVQNIYSNREKSIQLEKQMDREMKKCLRKKTSVESNS